MEYWRNNTERAEPEHFKKNLSSGHFVQSEAGYLWWEASDQPSESRYGPYTPYHVFLGYDTTQSGRRLHMFLMENAASVFRVELEMITV